MSLNCTQRHTKLWKKYWETKFRGIFQSSSTIETGKQRAQGPTCDIHGHTQQVTDSLKIYSPI